MPKRSVRELMQERRVRGCVLFSSYLLVLLSCYHGAHHRARRRAKSKCEVPGAWRWAEHACMVMALVHGVITYVPRYAADVR